MMPRLLRRLGAPLGCLCLVAASPAAAAITAGDFAGTWQWQAYSPSMQPETDSITVLVADDGTISGTVKVDGINYPFDRATVSGIALQFQTLYQATTDWALLLDGTLSEDTLIPGSNTPPPTRYSTTHIGAPVITSQPRFEPPPIAGGQTSLSIAVTSPGPVSYEWQHTGADIPGDTAATVSLVNVQAADEGGYTCIVRNSAGAVLSASAILMLYQPTGSDSFLPFGLSGSQATTEFSGPPAVQVRTDTWPLPGVQTLVQSVTTGNSNVVTATMNTRVSFQAGATGVRPLQAQWSKDGVAIAGATGQTLVLPQVGAADAATYGCSISNAEGASTWAARLNIVAAPAPGAPAFSIEPVNITAPAGGSAYLNATALSTSGPLSLQWYHDGVAIPGATAVAQPAPGPTLVKFTSYGVSPATLSAAGRYFCRATNPAGSTDSTTVLVQITGSAPIAAAEPRDLTVVEGTPWKLEFDVNSDAVGLTGQWYHDGLPVTGSMAQSGTRWTITTWGAGVFRDAGTYTCLVTTVMGTVTSRAVKVTVVPAGRIVNVSTRVFAGGAAGSPICGFVIGGTATMPVVVRAVGPTLATFGVADALPDPTMKLTRPDGTWERIQDWDAGDAAQMEASGAFPLHAGSADAAMLTSLVPGPYTSIASDALGGQGVVLLEAYDGGGASTDARFVNASTRGFVGTGDQVMITGFVIDGSGPVRVLVRAVGPTLQTFGVGGVLADPQLKLVHNGTVVTENDNWQDGNDSAAVEAASSAVGAFALPAASKDAVILRALSAGAYSATVSGVGGTTGTAMVELYVVP